MLINSKSYFQTCLKQCKTNSYHAGEIMDLYSTGNPSIGVKKDLKAAIKLAKYWEKKKDYKEDEEGEPKISWDDCFDKKRKFLEINLF